MTRKVLNLEDHRDGIDAIYAKHKAVTLNEKTIVMKYEVSKHGNIITSAQTDEDELKALEMSYVVKNP